MKSCLSLLSVGLLAVSAANAQLVTPSSYAMPNGFTGTYNYWDDSYTGAGNNTVNGAALSGGLGDLTDGVIATDNWFNVEGPVGPHGPYVGWTIDPTITFTFASLVNIDEILIYADDANGAGGVSAPGSVDFFINGNLTNLPVVDPSGSAPFVIAFDTAGLVTDEVQLTFHRKNSWVFISEVQFRGSSDPVVPEPSAIGLLGCGAIAAFLGLRRRRA